MSNALGSTIAVPGHRLFGEFTELLAADGQIELPRLRSVARHVMENPASFLFQLKEMLRDDAAVRAAADRSYWHPNGFAKLGLFKSADLEFRIRLHVWQRISDEPPAG